MIGLQTDKNLYKDNHISIKHIWSVKQTKIPQRKSKGELEPESHLSSILAMEEFSKARDLNLGKSCMPQVNVPSAPVYLLS